MQENKTDVQIDWSDESEDQTKAIIILTDGTVMEVEDAVITRNENEELTYEALDKALVEERLKVKSQNEILEQINAEFAGVMQKYEQTKADAEQNQRNLDACMDALTQLKTRQDRTLKLVAGNLEKWAALPPERHSLEFLAVEFNNVTERLTKSESMIHREAAIYDSRTKTQIDNLTMQLTMERDEFTKSIEDYEDTNKRLRKDRQTLADSFELASQQLRNSEANNTATKEKAVAILLQLLERPKAFHTSFGVELYQEAKDLFKAFGGTFNRPPLDSPV